MKIESILFVCLGNICRSPLAEGIARKINDEQNLGLTIDSAGTSSWHRGEAPCANSQKVALQHQIDISNYKSRVVTKEDCAKFDLIIALDSSNKKDLESLCNKKIIKLGEFGFDGMDVPDPYHYNDFTGFEKVFDMIENSVKTLLKSYTNKNHN